MGQPENLERFLLDLARFLEVTLSEMNPGKGIEVGRTVLGIEVESLLDKALGFLEVTVHVREQIPEGIGYAAVFGHQFHHAPENPDRIIELLGLQVGRSHDRKDPDVVGIFGKKAFPFALCLFELALLEKDHAQVQPRTDVRLVERDRAPIDLFRFDEILGREIDVAEVDTSLDVVLVQTQDMVEKVDRLFLLPDDGVDQPEVVHRIDVVGFLLENRLVLLDRIQIPVRFVVSHAEVVMGFRGQIRFEGESLFIRPDGFVHLPLEIVGHSQKIGGVGLVLVDCQGAPEIGGGLGILFLLQIQFTEIAERFGIHRIDRDRLLEHVLGLLVQALLQVEEPEEVESLLGIGIDAHRLDEALLGFLGLLHQEVVETLVDQLLGDLLAGR